MEPEAIIATVTRVTDVAAEELHRHHGTRPIVWARFLAIAAIRHRHAWTLERTGRYFGRHHTNIIHSSRRHRELLKAEPGYAFWWALIHQLLSTQQTSPAP